MSTKSYPVACLACQILWSFPLVLCNFLAWRFNSYFLVFLYFTFKYFPFCCSVFFLRPLFRHVLDIIFCLLSVFCLTVLSVFPICLLCSFLFCAPQCVFCFVFAPLRHPLTYFVLSLFFFFFFFWSNLPPALRAASSHFTTYHVTTVCRLPVCLSALSFLLSALPSW